MAIEAASQVASDQKILPPEVDGKTVSIVSSILAPSENDVEILFDLQSVNASSSRNRAKWFNFKVAALLWMTDGQSILQPSDMVGFDEIQIGKQ